MPHFIITVVFFVLSWFPGAIWSGAITPVATTRKVEAKIAVPRYQNVWPLNFTDYNGLYTKTSALGEFTFAPQFRQEGIILDHAKNTLSWEGGTAAHAKLDRTGYIYTTRSYGVGSSAGLTDRDFQPTPKGYRFSENGVKATVECAYNYSSQYRLERKDKPLGSPLNVYATKGSFPNHETSEHAAAALDDRAACVMGAASSNSTTDQSTDQSTYYVAFATLQNSLYEPLDKLQCQILYQPTVFSVAVNVTNRTIEVQPENSTVTQWLATMPLAQAATRRLDLMAQVFGTTQWRSILCDSFLTNIDTYVALHLAGSQNESAPHVVAPTLQSMLDGLLSALAAAQVQVLEESLFVPVVLDTPAFSFGSGPYVIANFVLNMVVALVVSIEALRTRLWRVAPRFNPMDVEHIISASLSGRRRTKGSSRNRKTKAKAQHPRKLHQAKDPGQKAGLTVSGQNRKRAVIQKSATKHERKNTRTNDAT
ncbi:hypothetical protein PG999_004037 [Apiospora kogelbergensis]|uniref:Uncharacterized protein n=1 Tax=Apiospora kogelbergensis TaxID=1337665 RepID=A0AAW0R5F4_9PEZI